MVRVSSDLRLAGAYNNLERIEDLVEVDRQYFKEIAVTINGKISFGDGVDPDNIEGSWISVTTPVTPDTDFTVIHGLNRLPVGVIVMRKAAAVDIYDGSIADTTASITLKATVGGIAVVLFIV